MKWFLGIFGIAAAGFMGYVMEPSMRASLVGTGRAQELASAKTSVPDEASGSEDNFATPPPPLPTPQPAPPESPKADPPPVVEVDPVPTPMDGSELADANDSNEPEMVIPPVQEADPVVPDAPDAPAAPTPSADVVAVMQASIKGGQIKEFTFDQVQGWKAGEDEDVDGQLYQTGLLVYTADTLFGKRTLQAKAFIKDGKVERWIWPTSGMEIK
jgi:hypothetical protein